MKRVMSLYCWLSLAACAAPRFVERPVVWKVDDTRDVPVAPAEREYFASQYMADAFLLRRASRGLELHPTRSAQNVNAWDEVPDSTWFTNRLGVRDYSPEEAANGPLDGPDPLPPLSILAGKSGGGNPGFIVRDQLGRSFLVKFDPKENPEMQTGTDAIVSRIFWVLGYNVPKDRVFVLCREQLSIAPQARTKNALLEKVPFTAEHLEQILGAVARRSDGCYRALSSEMLPGVAIGGAAPEGVRDDDPNDTIPHQHRRELRGLSVFAAWLNHTDMKEDNTLDMWQEHGSGHHVVHYLVDFGEAFAAHAAEKGRYEDGYEHFWDWKQQSRALASFGLWVRQWEHLEDTRWASVGAFSHQHFDPQEWREAYPYWPFSEADEADRYWAAKLVMRFSAPMIRRIVAQGELSDPAAEDYLSHTLVERARLIGRSFLEAVTPLDEFRPEPGRLCMVDLGVRHGLAEEGRAQVVDARGQVLEEVTVGAEGELCLRLDPRAGYEVLRVRTVRGKEARKPIELHTQRGALLGVVRSTLR